MAGTIDSKGWTGGEPPAEPYRDEVRIWRRQLSPSTPIQFWGRFHAMLPLASPFLLWVADWVLRASSADLCESVPGWVGIVYRAAGDPERDCGTGANLPGPRPYAGPCRSGWVPENGFEVPAG